MGIEGIEENTFACSLSLSGAIPTSPALGQNDRHPVGGAITAAVIAAFIHEGLPQKGLHLIRGAIFQAALVNSKQASRG